MNLLTLEDEKFKTVDVNGYKFRIRYMSPIDRVQIAQRRVSLQNGNPIESFTTDDFIFFENIAMVDVCVEEYPKEFKSNETCAKWPIPDLINSVADEIRKHTLDLEEKLKKNKPIVGGE